MTQLRYDNQGDNVVVGNVSTALQAGYQVTEKVDVIQFRWVDWVFRFTNLGAGPVTRLDCLVQYSTKLGPDEANDRDWDTVQVDAIDTATGVSTLVDYQPQRAIVGAAPLSLGLITEVQGRWMRIKFKAGVGDPANSVTTITAYRRA